MRTELFPKKPARTELLKKELSYLGEIKEVKWWEVDDNNVYIGFDPVPEDWELITKGAALRGNKTIDFGCHAWAVSGGAKRWRPGNGPYLGEFTARYGRVEG